MEFKKVKALKRVNYLLIPVNALQLNEDNCEYFNQVVLKCQKKEYNKIIRTKSGGISVKTRTPAYDVRTTSSIIELTVLEGTGDFRLQLRQLSKEKDAQNLYGRQAFNKFKEILNEYGIDLDSYQIDNGKEVKKEIEKYIIALNHPNFNKDIIWENAHHVDFHSSFASGLAITHPEFKPALDFIFSQRKTDPIYKLILNASIGYMQSEPCCKARWAHLSRDAINNNNDRVRNLAKRLEESGRIVIAYNTDGIWYKGEIYHDENEGPGLGQYANDHTNCKIRFKSEGSYEFIENGVYNPVVRGRTNLDKIKDRSEWEWGDIYKAQLIKFYVSKDGLVRYYKER